VITKTFEVLLLVLVLALAGCSCATSVGLLAAGVAGNVVTAAAVALDLGPAACRACRP